MKWFVGVNALRFLAIAMIVIYHLFRDFLPGGFIAVDIFFAISGFFIVGKLIREFAEKRKIGYWKFIGSRLAKLLPGLLVCVVLTLIASFFIDPNILAGMRLNTLSALTFTTNIKELITGGGYENTISPNLFEHTWFLALEMQFYLIVPLIVTFVMGAVKDNRKGAKMLGIFFLSLAFVSSILMGIYGGIFGMTDRAYFAIDSHMGSFCLGATFAALNYLIPRTPRTKKIIPGIGVALSLMTILILSTKLTYDNPATYIFGLPFVGVLTVIILFCIIKLQPNVHIRRRANLPIRTLEKLGQYSYGIYLIHWPLSILLPNILPQNIEPWINPALNIALSFAISYAIVKLFNPKKFSKKFKTSDSYRNAWAIASVALIIPCAIALVRIPDVSNITEQLNSMRDNEVSQRKDIEEVDYVGATSILANTKEAMLAQLDVEANLKADPKPTGSHAAPNANTAQVLVIGDSVTLGAKQALESTINGVYVDAKESRGIWTTRGILAEYMATGALPDVIVISLITNEFAVSENYLQSIVDVAGTNHKYIFVTGYAGPQQPREHQNQVVKDFAAKRDYAYVADWWMLSHDNWSLMYADHIHLNPEGRTTYANLINNVIKGIKR